MLAAVRCTAGRGLVGNGQSHQASSFRRRLPSFVPRRLQVIVGATGATPVPAALDRCRPRARIRLSRISGLQPDLAPCPRSRLRARDRVQFASSFSVLNNSTPTPRFALSSSGTHLGLPGASRLLPNLLCHAGQTADRAVIWDSNWQNSGGTCPQPPVHLYASRCEPLRPPRSALTERAAPPARAVFSLVLATPRACLGDDPAPLLSPLRANRSRVGRLITSGWARSPPRCCRRRPPGSTSSSL